MPEEKKFPYVHAKIDSKIIELFLGLEETVGPNEKHEVQEILGELKIGHKEEALNLLRFFKAKKESEVESEKKLTDELEMVQREIKITKNIFKNPGYEKEWDVYKETLEKHKKEQDELLKKIEQAKSAAAVLPSIEKIEKELEES